MTGSLERSSSEDSGLAASPHVDGMVMRETVASAEKMQGLLLVFRCVISKIVCLCFLKRKTK